jgi:hypothetical protein
MMEIEEPELPPYPYEEEFGGLMDIVEEEGNYNTAMPPLPPK